METTPQIERHLTANMTWSKKQIMLYNFLGGVAWGVGTVIGATIVVALLFSLIRSLGFIPFIGDLFQLLPEATNPRQLPR